MKRRRNWMLLFAIGTLSVWVTGFVAGCSSRGDITAELENGRLKPCPSSPNCVCSEDTSEGVAIAPFAVRGTPSEAILSLVEYLRELSNVEIVKPGPEHVHAVFYTPIFRFADDVEFRPDDEAGVIHVRSASRVGHSDLGTNRARIERLRREWSGTQ